VIDTSSSFCFTSAHISEQYEPIFLPCFRTKAALETSADEDKASGGAGATGGGGGRRKDRRPKWWSRGLLLAALVESGGDVRRAAAKLLAPDATLYRTEMRCVKG
jgi:hypothetical protein